MKLLTNIDEQVFYWIANRPNNQANKCGSKIFRMISRTGDGYVYAILAGILYSTDDLHGTPFVYTALLAYALELPIYVLLKQTIKRPRPCDLRFEFEAHIVPSDKFSLPSGHTAAAFLMATVLAHFYPSVGILAYGWASLIGLSRLVLRVHYPLDVIAGAGLGTLVAIIFTPSLGAL